MHNNPKEALEKVLNDFSTLKKAQSYISQDPDFWKRHNFPSYWTTFQNDQDLPIGFLEYYFDSYKPYTPAFDVDNKYAHFLEKNYLFSLMALMANNGLTLNDKLKNNFSFFPFGYYLFFLNAENIDDTFLLDILTIFYKANKTETKIFFTQDTLNLIQGNTELFLQFTVCKNHFLVLLEQEELTQIQKKLEKKQPLPSTETHIL